MTPKYITLASIQKKILRKGIEYKDEIADKIYQITESDYGSISYMDQNQLKDLNKFLSTLKP